MNTAWNQISVAQQNQFLQATGLQQLPDPAALDAAQWNALVGIVGEETAKNIRQSAAGGNLTLPELPAPGAIGDWSSIMAKVAEIQAKIGELQKNVSAEEIQAQKDDMAAANKKEAERIKEMLAKIEKSKTSGLFGKIFGWIGAIIGVIGAAIATVATGGAAAPALAIACVGLGMMILQETGAMEKIVNFLAENPAVLMVLFGPVAGGLLFGLIEGGVIDKDQAKMAIQITFAAAMLVASIAGMVATGGASATDAVFKVIGLIGQIAGGVAQVGAGASGIAQSVYSYQAANLDADSKEMQAWLAKLQAMLSEEMDRLQEVIDKLNSGVADVSDILTDIAESNRTVISHMGA